MAQSTESWAAEQGTEYEKEPIGQDGVNQTDGKVYPLGTEENPMVETWKKLVWHGGSVYDAWLNAASAQVGWGCQLLTTPAFFPSECRVSYHLIMLTSGQLAPTLILNAFAIFYQGSSHLLHSIFTTCYLSSG